jgi:hypothetical protein
VRGLQRWFVDIASILWCSSDSLSLFVAIAGTASNALALNVSCPDCQAGSYSEAGASVCFPCHAGSFSSAARSSSCQTCASGLYADSGSATFCRECQSGFKRLSPSSCVVCEAGSYSADPRSSRCWQCAVGTHADLAGATICANCPSGRSLWCILVSDCFSKLSKYNHSARQNNNAHMITGIYKMRGVSG